MIKFKIFLCISLVVCIFVSISTMMRDFCIGLFSLIVVIIGLVINIIDLIKIRKIKTIKEGVNT